MRHVRAVLFAALAALVTACGSGHDTPTQAPTSRLSGMVTGGGAGVTIQVTGPDTQTVTTDNGGGYEATRLRPGTYTVTPLLAGAVFTPVRATVSVGTTAAAVPAFTRQTPSEGLSPEELRRLDTIPPPSIPASARVLPNGEVRQAYRQRRNLPNNPLDTTWLPADTMPRLSTVRGLSGMPSSTSGLARVAAPSAATPRPQEIKNDIVTAMTDAAIVLACGRYPQRCTTWDYPADPADPVLRPAQMGLTYIWGGKDHTVLTRGVDGCPTYTRGLDCSGLISTIARVAGLRAPAGSAAQSDPKNWTVPQAWQLKFILVPPGTYEAGDIVAWPGHIGIVDNPGTNPVVVSATGSSGACATNIKPPKGPRPLLMAQLKSSPPTAVLRLVTTLSGDFDLYLRCAGRGTDAAVIRFTINNDQGGPFEATGSGVDYDGQPLSFTLRGSYNQITNTVDARLTTTNDNRVDAFTVTLRYDDTGYFPMTKVVNNGGCGAEARLVRVAKGAALPRLSRAPASGGPPSGSRLGGPPRP